MTSLSSKPLDPEAFCHSHHVNYTHPVDDPAHFTYCPVPEKGFDSLAFMAIAILVAALQKGKMSALVVFSLGCFFQVLAFSVNLGPIANGLNLWLGISPAELFMYGFLPPLLFDSAVRIEMYIFKKMLAKVLTMAFLVVLASTAMMVPLLLYVFRLSALGWTWVQAALFVAIVASTDAVTVNALVKAGGGPEEMTILLEGESLFNDASSLTLFSIFFALSMEVSSHGEPATPPVLPTLKLVLNNLAVLAAGGALFGYVVGYCTRKLIGWMQKRGAKPYQELAIVFSMAYISYYGGQAILHCSGVVAVVVFGLYGAARGRWELSTKATSSGAFDGFLGTITFGINGLIFFYAGASAVNFVWRSIDVLLHKGLWYHLAVLLGIYVSMFLTRYLSIAFFNLFFTCMGIGIPRETVLFATVSGLRGALSLIMVQVVIQDQARLNDGKAKEVHTDIVTAQLVLYTAGFVLLTLLINAPLMPWFMEITGLTKVSPASMVIRDKARRALIRFTKGAIQDLKDDEDEILRGVDWKHVEEHTDLSNDLLHFKLPTACDKDKKTVTRESTRELSKLTSTIFEDAMDEPLLAAADVEHGTPHVKDSHFSFDQDTPLLLEKDEDLDQPPPAELLHSLRSLDEDAHAGSACPYAFPSDMDAVGSTQPATYESSGVGNSMGVVLPAVRMGKSDSARCLLPAFYAANKDVSSMAPTTSAAVQARPQGSTIVTQRSAIRRAVSSTYLPRNAMSEVCSDPEHEWHVEFQAESRMRLVNGFKRFAHSKRDEGLLSAKGLRLLDYACDEAIDESARPLNIWMGLEKEIVGRWWVSLLAHTHIIIRRFKMFSQKIELLRWTGLALLLDTYSGYLGRQLSEKLLLACEVAMGYFLALSYTPFAQWLAESDDKDHRVLQAEVKAEAGRVWQFIIDREVEAPERFQAIQSYRAAMAVMHQQLGFVEELYMSGMIDEAEKEIMEHPIERRINSLERTGATWQSPRTRDIVAGLPFLENVPQHVVDEFLAQGDIKYYASGDVIFTPLHITANAGGLYCVLHGMVKGFGKSGNKAVLAVLLILPASLPKLLLYSRCPTSHRLCSLQVTEFFLGSGRMFGLLSALTGDGLPGYVGMMAAGNALGKGPVLFHVPTDSLQALLAKADSGDPAYVQLELDLYRVAACYTLDRLKCQLISASTRAYGELLRAAEGGSGAGDEEEDDKPMPRLARRRSRKVSAQDLDSDDSDDEDVASATPATPFVRAAAQPEAVAPGPSKKVQAAAKKLALHLVQSAREGICDSELVQLAKGQRLSMKRHMVLLKGRLLSQRVSLPAAGASEANAAVAREQAFGPAPSGMQHIQFQGPTVIPSLLSCPEARSTLGVEPAPLQFHALTDCLLLMCGTLKATLLPGISESSKSLTDDMLAAATGPTAVEGNLLPV